MSIEADLKAIDDFKVDSRNVHNKVTHPTLPLERTYCAFCGKEKGWVSQESSEHIAAFNVVVVCDDCDEKFKASTGLFPGEEVHIPEVDLHDAELGAWLDGTPTEWVENCVDCRVPMIKLQPVAVGKYVPLMDTLKVGECVLDRNRLNGIERDKRNAVPHWFCRKCRALWGPIDMFWCKFRKV